jgi:tetratricopeptide (TPR) repeat protein
MRKSFPSGCDQQHEKFLFGPPLGWTLAETDQRLMRCLIFRDIVLFGQFPVTAPGKLVAPADIISVADAVHLYRQTTAQNPQDNQGWLDLGDAAATSGLTSEAENAYRRYLSLANEIADNLYARAMGNNRLGDILKVQGRLPEALEYFKASLDITQSLADTDPDNVLVQANLSIAIARIGDVHMEQNNLPEALGSYGKAVAVAQRLVEANGEKLEWQSLLVTWYTRIGYVQFTDANFPAAHTFYEMALAKAKDVLRDGPGDTSARTQLAIVLAKIGDVRVKQNDLTAALGNYWSAESLFRDLAQQDGTNVDMRLRVAHVQLLIGDVYFDQNSLTKALREYVSSLTIFQGLAEAGVLDSQSVITLLNTRFDKFSGGQLEEAVKFLTKQDAEGKLSSVGKEWLASAKERLGDLP